MVISKFVTWGAESFLINTSVNGQERAGTRIIFPCCQMGVLNASNQRQSMYCHTFKLTEASSSRNYTNLNKSNAISKDVINKLILQF